MSRLIISARYWNNVDWVEASLKHIEAWGADQVWISEGNWDQQFDLKSTDKTREIIEDFSQGKSNYHVFDNPRVSNNYRYNQALTSNVVMSSAKAEVGDWMLIIDADHFYSKVEIAFIKEAMRSEPSFFDYFTTETYCFIRGIDEYVVYFDEVGTKLPYKIISKYCTWIPTNHLAYNNVLDNSKVMYKDLGTAREFRVNVNGLHYEAQMSKERFKQKYSIGNRKTPEASGRFKNFFNYADPHNEFAIPVLEGYGYKFDSHGYLI